MRRATAILLCLFLIVNIVLPVSAATSITESRMNASVATDGTCIINLELHFRLCEKPELLGHSNHLLFVCNK